MCAAVGALIILLLVGYAPVSAMTFSAVRFDDSDPTAVIIVMSGDIEHGDAERFADYYARVRASYHVAAFALDSRGGYVLEAGQMGSLLHAAGATMLVGARSCASACFLLFAAGVERYAVSSAAIGVHSASTEGQEDKDSLAVTTLVARKLAEFGIPPSIVAAAVTTRPGEVTWLDTPHLAAMNVHIVEASLPATERQPAFQPEARTNVVAETPSVPAPAIIPASPSSWQRWQRRLTLRGAAIVSLGSNGSTTCRKAPIGPARSTGRSTQLASRAVAM